MKCLGALPWLIRGKRGWAVVTVDPWFAEVFEGDSGHCFHQGLQGLGLEEHAVGDEKRRLGCIRRGAVSEVFGAKGGRVQLIAFCEDLVGTGQFEDVTCVDVAGRAAQGGVVYESGMALARSTARLPCYPSWCQFQTGPPNSSPAGKAR